jgi:pilus assembly protein Flp/PilA
VPGIVRAKCKELQMKGYMSRVREFLVSEDGPTATEYAVMLALIIIVALTAIGFLGQKVSDIFTGIDGKLVVPA